MLHYSKGRNIEQELSKDDTPFDSLPEKFLWMQVSKFYAIFISCLFAKRNYVSR